MALQPGSRLGSFEVLGPLGAGGMGEVYRARDMRLGRDVAIKVLPEAFAKDPARAARFEREARLLAAINHPAIGAIYGAEEFDSLPCIIMEFVPGETLAEKLSRGAPPLEEACGLALQIAEALEAAHDKGVVHRDLKPSNIKVTPEAKVKVLDLGLAKAMEPPQPADLSRSPTMPLEETRPGVVLGTVEFMSPEQARGKPVDKRTDIWAFGCILFEMLSGQRAFGGESAADVFAAILGKEPNWEALPAATPPRLRELLARCLEKDPRERLRDIGDARIAIAQALAPEGQPRPETGRRFRIFAGAAALVVATAVFAWRAWRAPSPPHGGTIAGEKHLIVLPFRDFSTSPQSQLVGDGLVETVSARLARMPGVQVMTPSATIAASDKEADPFRIARGLGADLILRTAIQRAGDQVRFTYSLLNVERQAVVGGGDVTGLSSDLFGAQDRLTEKLAEDLRLPRGAMQAPAPSGLVTAADQERYLQALGNLQRYDRSTSIDQAMRLLEALAAERPASAMVHAALGRAYLYKFNLTRDKSWAGKASESVASARQLDPNLPEVDSTSGELFLRTGKPGEAIASFHHALAAQPDSFDALLGLARAYDSSGDAKQAEEAYRRAIRLQPSYWSGYSKLGGFFFYRGNYRAAAQMFEQAVARSPENARALGNLGAAYHAAGDLEKALATYRRSLALEPTDLTYSNIGTLEYELGRYREASEAYEKAIRLVPGHFQLWANLADAYRFTKGSESKAREAYERAIALCRGELKVNPSDPIVLAYLAASLAKTGRPAEAEERVRQALAAAPENPEVIYLSAIVANLAHRDSEALERIRRAAKAGYNRAKIAQDPDLANLRSKKSFQETVSRTASLN